MELILVRLLIGLVAVYGAAVGYLSIRETSLVFRGMGRTFRMLPAPQTGIPWDTVHVGRTAD